MLIDSNIIIYASQKEHASVRKLLSTINFAVSAITTIEVLGYHKLNELQQQYFSALFQQIHILPISQKVIHEAIILRQQKSMTLGDAIIAGTAIAYHLKLITNNISDFEWIQNIDLLNPFEK